MPDPNRFELFKRNDIKITEEDKKNLLGKRPLPKPKDCLNDLDKAINSKEPDWKFM